MKTKILKSVIFTLIAVMASGYLITRCSAVQRETFNRIKKTEIEKIYGVRTAKLWSEKLPGVKTAFETDEEAIALTFDACGSKNDGFDEKLIDYLIKGNVPATLFITGRWINKYPKEFKALADNPLFEIENHGLNHKPCSVNGQSAYKIQGTLNAGEVFDEIELNAEKLFKLTSRKPKFYRAGTAFYDEVAVEIAGQLGYQIAGYSVLGDAGATYKKDKVKEALLTAPAGSIVLMHMNHPEGDTAEGVIEAIPLLIKKGYKFVKLEGLQFK